MRFIERLQAALPAARSACQAERGRRQAAPCCVVTSTLEREGWRGELPEEARTDTTGRLPWAPANAASKHGWFTPRAMRRAKPVAGQCRSARRRMRATSLSGRCCGLGRSGEYRIQPDFPAWGVLHWFDVAKSGFARFAKPCRAHADIFATDSAGGTHRAVPPLPIEFFLSNFPLPRHVADRIRLWARSLPAASAVRATCCISFVRGEQQTPGASKIAVCACASCNPPEPGRSGRPQRNAGQNYIQYE